MTRVDLNEVQEGLVELQTSITQSQEPPIQSKSQLLVHRSIVHPQIPRFSNFQIFFQWFSTSKKNKQI